VKLSKEELEAKAKHFANTVFAIGAGVIMLAASLLHPYVLKWLGPGIGEHAAFIVATALIVVLAAKRPSFALYSIGRECSKHGHVLSKGSRVCERCYRNIP